MRSAAAMLLLTLAGFLSSGVLPLDAPKDRAGSGPRDPVCGVTCLDDKCEREQWRSQQYSFCSTECRDKFRADPDRYRSKP